MPKTVYDMYIQDAADYYENAVDETDYQYCYDNHYRWFLIKEYADWMMKIDSDIRIWE